jgi:hypothetical protein
MNSRIESGMRIAVVAALVLPLAPVTEAHHSPDRFDPETPVSVSGTVVRFEYSAPHSFVYVEQQTPGGAVEWAVEGPSPIQLERRGMDANVFALGDSVEACGYTLKEPATTGKYAGKRVLLAEVMVMPDGEVRIWSPYGNDRCRVRQGYVVSDR